MASSDVLSQTLSSITSIKLDEISNQRKAFEVSKSELLSMVQNETNQHKKVELLLHINSGVMPGFNKIESDTSIQFKNITRFMEQAHMDPSVSGAIQKDWQSKLEKQLGVQTLKYEYASLFGQLVNEWLNTSKEATETASEGEMGFESIGRKEMHEQRKKWESMVFEAKETNTQAIDEYLTKIFNSTKAIKTAYEHICTATQVFESQMATPIHFDQSVLLWVINGLLRSDLVSDEKRKVLNDFLNNKVVLDEIADVLNMRMSALDKWQWDSEGTAVEQRRQLNGRYRFYHDEDLLQTMLLRYIGVKWSVFFKGVFETFQRADEVWKSSSQKVTPEDRERRDYFLGPESYPSVEDARHEHFKNDIFLEQLQGKLDEQRGGYDDDSEDENDTRKTGQQITQTLLHTLAAEIIMKTHLGEDVNVVRTDFAWFGPSLPYSSMFAVLKFFKVSDRWIDFFRRALEAPMKFVQDGPDAEVKTRKRGTPISGPLSDFLAETVLFCLDFGFNQESNGTRLYRLHDDIWFWGSEEQCVKGWEIMTHFAKLSGLDFNPEKTGSVRVTKVGTPKDKPAKVHHSLPKGEVRWGFLTLDSQTGRFLIDQKQVDKHINELRFQLDRCKSIFEWIHAWNIYGCRFFINNFGRPSHSFGIAHVDMLLETFARIQSKLFASTGGSVTSTLKKMISDKFKVENIPEGYLYFPLSMGGLDLKSPFIDLYLIRGSMKPNTNIPMEEYFEAEDKAYHHLKRVFDEGKVPRRSYDVEANRKYYGKPFLTMEEYTQYREQTSRNLRTAYLELTEEPEVQAVTMTRDVSGFVGAGLSWRTLSPYQQWIIQLYAADMIARFGSLNVVEKGLLPTGMVSMFRESRFKWQG